jgi:hypothetical protein
MGDGLWGGEWSCINKNKFDIDDMLAALRQALAQ